ncbi:polysaccharide deacetylase family protein [Bacillus luti]
MKRLINGKIFTALLICIFTSFFAVDYFFNSEDKHIQAKQPAKKVESQTKAKEEKKETKEEFAKKKIVYLTFDDGPSNHTKESLEVLKKENVKATFFAIGKSVENRKELLKDISDDGHYIGLHSMTHEPNRIYPASGKPDNFINEMKQLQKEVKEITKQNSVLIRAPYGSKPYLKKPYQEAILANGFKIWDWNIDSNDWKYQATPEKILETIQSQVREDRTKHVVLMHEKAGTIQVLPKIIQHFKNLGYEFRAYNPEQHFPVNFWYNDNL